MSPSIIAFGITVINFVPSYLPFYFACLICMQAVEQTKPKVEGKKQKIEEVLTCSVYL